MKAQKFVYVVNYAYSYEGQDTQAVFSSLDEAKKYPWGGDKKLIYKFPLLNEFKEDWNKDFKFPEECK